MKTNKNTLTLDSAIVINNYLLAMHNGDLEQAFDMYSKYKNSDCASMLETSHNVTAIYEKLTPDTLSKLSAWNPENIKNPYFKTYVSNYQQWSSTKSNLDFYTQKAREYALTQKYLEGINLLSFGLKLYPDAPYLQMYYAYIIIFIPIDEQIGEQLPVLDKLLDELPVHEDFLRYIKAAGLLKQDKMKEAKEEMKKAVMLNNDYQRYFDYYFPNQK